MGGFTSLANNTQLSQESGGNYLKNPQFEPGSGLTLSGLLGGLGQASGFSSLLNKMKSKSGGTSAASAAAGAAAAGTEAAAGAEAAGTAAGASDLTGVLALLA